MKFSEIKKGDILLKIDCACELLHEVIVENVTENSFDIVYNVLKNKEDYNCETCIGVVICGEHIPNDKWCKKFHSLIEPNNKP